MYKFDSNHGEKSRLRTKKKNQFIACPNPDCEYEKNSPNASNCLLCNSPLHPSVSEQINSSKARNKLKVIKTKTISQVRGKNQKTSGQRLFLFSTVGVVVLASSIFLASTLNASPEAKLKRARGRIPFGGEPCAQRMVNEKVGKAISKLNPDVTFRYTDNDRNKDQIQELIEGLLKIAFSEQVFLNSHLERAKERGVTLKPIPYAYDGIAYVTDESTEVRPLTVEELEAIFEGRITNWKQLGGEDREIRPILMAGMWQNPMGIRLDDGVNPNTIFIKDRVKGKKILKKTEGAIFYTSASLAADELDEVNVISIKKSDGTVVSPVLGEGVTNKEAIASNQYPLVRTLILIVKRNDYSTERKNALTLQQKAVRAFADYLISPQGQRIVEDTGFVAMHEVAKEPTDKKFSLLPWL